jgi:hypothetical protein
MKNFLSVVLSLTVAALVLASCGREDCFSVGPFGSCGNRDAAPSDRAATGGTTSGDLRLRTERPYVKPNDRLEIITEGGVMPYRYKVLSGVGASFETENSRFLVVTGGKVGENIKIRVMDSAQPNKERTLTLEVDN